MARKHASGQAAEVVWLWRECVFENGEFVTIKCGGPKMMISYGWPKLQSLDEIPHYECIYADKHGVVHRQRFDEDELMKWGDRS